MAIICLGENQEKLYGVGVNVIHQVDDHPLLVNTILLITIRVRVLYDLMQTLAFRPNLHFFFDKFNVAV